MVRRNKIINSTNPKFFGYGHKISDIEKITKSVLSKFQCNYKDALDVCINLFSSNIIEEKFAGIFFLNHFKRNFNQATIDMFEDLFRKHCDTWAICDSSCIRVIGPFLGKKDNKNLAESTIGKWLKSDNIWIKRASMVILLKIVMINKEFNEDYVFELVDQMLNYTEDYIQKGIGWLLKTCSNYDSNSIFNYLMKNKERIPRLILRYASEKMPKERRELILKK